MLWRNAQTYGYAAGRRYRSAVGLREFPESSPGVIRYDGRAEDGTVATASWYEANGRVTLVTDPGGDPFDAALEAITALRDHVRRTTA